MNLLKEIPAALPTEVFETILSADNLRIERIISKGHTTPADEWYDQDEHEWVLILQGAGELTFEDGSTVKLNVGDHLLLPAHQKHRVSWTDPTFETIWLALFYR